MTITSQTYTPFGAQTLVEVVSDLSSPTLYWYLDGVFVGSSTETSRWFWVSAGEQAEVVVLDSVDPAFDPVANQPSAYPARKVLWWVRSIDADVALYRIKEDKDGGGFATVGEVAPPDGAWSFQFLTPRLDDLATYTWNIVPVDAAGNEGAPHVEGPELVVRKPDAPDFTATFNPGPDTVTFAAA